jgi:hypothetical protein
MGLLEYWPLSFMRDIGNAGRLNTFAIYKQLYKCQKASATSQHRWAVWIAVLPPPAPAKRGRTPPVRANTLAFNLIDYNNLLLLLYTAEFIDPWRGWSQLRHRVVLLACQPCSLLCRCDNPLPELILSSVRVLWIRLSVSCTQSPKAVETGAQAWDIRSLGFSWFLHLKVSTCGRLRG